MSVGVTTYELDPPSGDSTTVDDLAGKGGANQTGAPIDRLGPGTPKHQALLTHLLDLVKMSEREMTKFHTRWRANEMQYQAYMSTKTAEELRKAAIKGDKKPEFVDITVPYTYASVQTIVTYLLHTFCGRRPLWQIGSNRDDKVRLSQNLETVLQYNADHERAVRKLYQFFHDGEQYGVQIMRLLWKVQQQRVTRFKQVVPGPAGLVNLPRTSQRVQEVVTKFEGNDIWNIDPFDFFPDPRCPMEQVHIKGEFVFWRTSEGEFALKKAESDGLLKWVAHIGDMPNDQRQGQSTRNRLAEGNENPASNGAAWTAHSKELLQGTVEIVPSKWGLGDSDHYEKWLFTIGNRNQIIQAEPLDLDHDNHPVIVGEPYSTGYGFGNVGVSDMLQPMQEMMSWMLNSHIYNVRSVLNNTLVVNPQMVDMEDLKKPGPGRVIKLKPAAFGQNVTNAISQLAVQDVTRTHVTDLGMITRFADLISSTNDNLRGVQAAGGRKTATEVRTSGEAGASRLAAHARLISSQSIQPMGEQMTYNYQQLMTEEIYLKILGANAQEAPLRIGPEDISGSFYFPVHDGTLPMDKVALLDVWREIFMAIIQNPGLAQIFDAVGIFEYIAELGGAKNLSTFRVQTADNAQVAAAIQAGNLIPGPAAAGMIPGGGVG